MNKVICDFFNKRTGVTPHSASFGARFARGICFPVLVTPLLRFLPPNPCNPCNPWFRLPMGKRRLAASALSPGGSGLQAAC